MVVAHRQKEGLGMKTTVHITIGHRQKQTHKHSREAENFQCISDSFQATDRIHIYAEHSRTFDTCQYPHTVRPEGEIDHEELLCCVLLRFGNSTKAFSPSTPEKVENTNVPNNHVCGRVKRNITVAARDAAEHVINE